MSLENFPYSIFHWSGVLSSSPHLSCKLRVSEVFFIVFLLINTEGMLEIHCVATLYEILYLGTNHQWMLKPWGENWWRTLKWRDQAEPQVGNQIDVLICVWGDAIGNTQHLWGITAFKTKTLNLDLVKPVDWNWNIKKHPDPFCSFLTCLLILWRSSWMN